MDFNEAIQYGLSIINYESLKEVQRKTVAAYLCGKDIFVCAPTGSGKSLCFEVAPYAINWVTFGPVEGETTIQTVCIVVAPAVEFIMKTKYIVHGGGDLALPWWMDVFCSAPHFSS